MDAYNDSHAAGDLATYRSYYGLGACTTSTKCLRVVNQNGTTARCPTGSSGWTLEESLDLDMVSSACPLCRIVLVEATDAPARPTRGQAPRRGSGAKFISNSWGGAEFSTETSYDSHFQPPGRGHHRGGGRLRVRVRASVARRSPDVTSVGGTTLWMKGKTRTEEKVWNLGALDGTGSGCSSVEPQPAWQAAYTAGAPGTGSTTTSRRTPTRGPGRGLRLLPSAGSGPAEGLAAARRDQRREPDHRGRVRTGQPGRQACHGVPAGQFPYQATSGLRDITIGSNGSCGGTYLCTAEVGYDGPTGLGVPNGVNAFK